jgi:hypothetical protein
MVLTVELGIRVPTDYLVNVDTEEKRDSLDTMASREKQVLKGMLVAMELTAFQEFEEGMELMGIRVRKVSLVTRETSVQKEKQN